ncbi:MAG: hypothetical protein WBQ25_05280 [Nitrososphaeraceae archaeon]
MQPANELYSLRTKWICPNCMELSPTRHWSVERHIRRKHTGIGEPISINTHQTRTQMNIQSGWSSFSAPTNTMQFSHETNKLQRDSSSYHYRNNYIKSDNNARASNQTDPENNTIPSATASNFDNEETRRGFLSRHTKKRSIIDDETLQLLHQMAEIKKFSGQNQLSSWLSTSIGDISNQFIGRQISDELVALFLIHKNIINNNRNFGYRGRLCYNCCSYWIDLVYNNKEEGMKSLMLEKPPRHECDPKKVLEISKCNIQDLARKRDQTYNGLSDFLTLMVSGIILFGQKPLYLYIEEIIEHDNRQLSSWIKEEDCINLGNIKEIKESHWAYRAIKQEKVGDKKQITIGGIELIDFARTTRATFGAFRVQMGEDDLIRYFFMHFSILN